jgi:signal transduction histidine kinase
MRRPDLKPQMGFARQRPAGQQPPPSDTELTRLHHEVAQLRKKLHAKDKFIALAAHELRNPMTPILGIAELAVAAAQRPGSSPQMLILLEKLHGGIEDFIGRSTRLLDVTRLEAGDFTLLPEPLDLSDLLLEIAGKHGDIAARGGSVVELQIARGITGAWDRLALARVIESLLSNALKYGSQKPVTLRLEVLGEDVRLDVQDRGIGLDAAQQTEIFGCFEQVVGSYRSGGLGLGLWTAKQLVTAMQGRISVHSRQGEGATFTVFLPLSGASKS